jgi:hypothetical protein
MRSSRIAAFLLIVTTLATPIAYGQQPENPGASSPAASGLSAAADAVAAPIGGTLNPDALPVDIDKIQRAISRPPAIRPESSRPVFRIQVFSRKPTIDDILGPDWRKGPTPAGAMTHQEFLNLVTPKDVQGYAAFDNKQAVTVAATSFALQWALKQAMRKFDDARTERQKQAARKEVDDALAALRKARRDAGLPDLVP